MAAPPLPPINADLSDRSLTVPTATSGGGGGYLGITGSTISGAATSGSSTSATGAPGLRLPSGTHHWVNYALVGIALFVAIRLTKKGKK